MNELYMVYGESRSLEEWARISGIPEELIIRRIKRNKMTLEQAMTRKGTMKVEGVGYVKVEPSITIMRMQWNFEKSEKLKRDGFTWNRPNLKAYAGNEVQWVPYSSRSGRYETVKE